MQKCIWSKYNKELVQRGSVTFLIDAKTAFSGQKRGKEIASVYQRFL